MLTSQHEIPYEVLWDSTETTSRYLSFQQDFPTRAPTTADRQRAGSGRPTGYIDHETRHMSRRARLAALGLCRRCETQLEGEDVYYVTCLACRRLVAAWKQMRVK